jgi:hypothetical protein
VEEHDAEKAETAETKKRYLEILWRAKGYSSCTAPATGTQITEEAIAQEAIKRMGG